ncbi:MAG: hypothetical protein ABI807_05520 [Sporichthyaceae bacterium]
MTALVSDESRAVAAVLRVAARTMAGEHRAGPRPVTDLDDEDLIGLLIAADHGIDPERLAAYRSLGRSRGLALDEVLRAVFRNELRDVVELPAVGRRAPST